LPGGCISIDFVNNKISINPSVCPGPFTRIFTVRILTWIDDLLNGIKAPNNFLEFRVIIVPPTSCWGKALTYGSYTSLFFDERYTNIDAPVAQSGLYYSFLALINPLVTINWMYSPIGCELIWRYSETFIR